MTVAGGGQGDEAPAPSHEPTGCDLHPRPEAALLGFARALRAAGVAVTADRERTYLEAVAAVGLDDRAAVRWAGHATLCASRADLQRHDQVFTAWFGLQRVSRRAPRPDTPTVTQAGLQEEPAGAEGGSPDVLRARASSTEVLRHRDIATMSAAERARLAALFAGLRPRAPRRRTPRQSRARRGAVDARRTLREQLRHLGEPGPIVWRRRGTRARRVVLLIDVSGSMSPYADALLRLAHRYVVSEPGVEVFTCGTRLTHVTAALQRRDPERALIACGQAVPDWSGGTRLAQSIDVFLRRWGRRGMARG
ncbi:MAG: VWA domain-containing protein, partial [Micrococcales bacterium]|nr:VWA domain-containing protein [Micrococcales bacterium]